MTDRTICEAIAARKLLEFQYDGGSRVVEPYVHGASKTGKDLLRAFQISGYSESGQTIGWKLFDLSKMSSLSIVNCTFSANRAEYNPDDKAMIQIYCHV